MIEYKSKDSEPKGLNYNGVRFNSQSNNIRNLKEKIFYEIRLCRHV
jgi:hypothetical protein